MAGGLMKQFDSTVSDRVVILIATSYHSTSVWTGMSNLHYEICTNWKFPRVKFALIDFMKYALKYFTSEICTNTFHDICTTLILSWKMH